MKIALYTVNLGDSDLIPLTCSLPKNVDAFYLTDKSAPAGWTECHIEPNGSLPTVAIAEAAKILPWVRLPNYAAYIYVDPDYVVVKDPTPLLTEDMVFVGHPNKRNASIYAKLNAQAREYMERGVGSYPAPHVVSSILFRKHTPAMREMCLRWWNEVIYWRNWDDQIALRYALHDQQYTVLEPEEVLDRYVSRLQRDT